MQQLPLASCRLCCHGLFFLACVPEHDWMFQHVHVLGWDISVVKHKIIMGLVGVQSGVIWPGEQAVLERVVWVQYLVVVWLMRENLLALWIFWWCKKVVWKHHRRVYHWGLLQLDALKVQWEALVLPGGTTQWVSAAHFTHMVHGEVVSIPSSCCDCGELDGGTEGWNTPSIGVKPAWHSPMRAAGDSTSCRTATLLSSLDHTEVASVVSAPWFYPFVISMICP